MLAVWQYWPRAALPEDRVVFFPMGRTSGQAEAMAVLPDVLSRLAAEGLPTVVLNDYAPKFDLTPEQFVIVQDRHRAAEVVTSQLSQTPKGFQLEFQVYKLNRLPESDVISVANLDDLPRAWGQALYEALVWQRTRQSFEAFAPDEAMAALYFWDGLRFLLFHDLAMADTHLTFGLEAAPKDVWFALLLADARIQGSCPEGFLGLQEASPCQDVTQAGWLSAFEPLLDLQLADPVAKGYRQLLLARGYRLLGDWQQSQHHLDAMTTPTAPWLLGLWFAEQAVHAQHRNDEQLAIQHLQAAEKIHVESHFPFYRQAFYAALAVMQPDQAQAFMAREQKLRALLTQP